MEVKGKGMVAMANLDREGNRACDAEGRLCSIHHVRDNCGKQCEGIQLCCLSRFSSYHTGNMGCAFELSMDRSHVSGPHTVFVFVCLGSTRRPIRSRGIDAMYRLAEWYLNQKPVVMTILLVPTLALLMMVSAGETMLSWLI